MDLIPRDLTLKIQEALIRDRVIALMGPRQSGKTTLVRRLLQSDRDLQYYNLKDPDVRQALQSNARLEFEQFKDSLIVLDEVQLMPALLEQIQLQVDARPEEKGRFLILGSNHLLLNRQIKESLAGRVMLFTLLPLSFHELAGHTAQNLCCKLILSGSTSEAAAVLKGSYFPANDAGSLNSLFYELDLFGGYPEFLTRKKPEDRKNWLRSYRQTYLNTDLRELVDLRNPESFERFEQLFAPRIGALLNISELARDCGLSADTIRRFLSYYRRLFIAGPSLPFYKNEGKRMMKMPKWYFFDTGVLRSLKNNFNPEEGVLFENTVISELRKTLYYETFSEELFFARSSTGMEVDAFFANKDGNVVFCCEIKQGSTVHRTDYRHLKKFVAPHEDRIGLLINRSDSIKEIEERIWQVPAPWFFG
ncbi:MAG: ATP-binding protein [Planctomycetes bacterium]|nr:ATP-binding protein [Planctomycetota bacterium]